VSINNHIWTSKLSITFDQLTFLLLFSTAVPRTTLQWSIPLLFLLNYVFYIHPIGHFRVAFCLCVKTSLSAKPFIWLLPTSSLSHFYVKGFARRLVLKQRQKETFIHELLSGTFDWDTEGVLGLSIWGSEGVLGLSFWDSMGVLGLRS